MKNQGKQSGGDSAQVKRWLPKPAPKRLGLPKTEFPQREALKARDPVGGFGQKLEEKRGCVFFFFGCVGSSLLRVGFL